MMWKVKIPVRPKLFETRTVKCFAWFPIKIWVNGFLQSEEYWIWFQTYYEDQTYYEISPYGSYYHAFWSVTRTYIKSDDIK